MRLSLAVLTFLLPSLARGNDVWVDPVLGDDSNPGTPLAPLRTISAAVFLPDAAINLVPGVYSVASGETFPITLEGADSIAALGNASDTRIVLPDLGSSGGYANILARGESSISGVTLEQLGSQTTALELGGLPTGTQLTLADSVILGGSVGVACNAGALSVLRSQFIGQEYAGLSISDGGALIHDATIRGARYGVFAEMFAGSAYLQRVSILDVQETAVQIYNRHYAVPLRVWIDDCLIAGHQFGVVKDFGSSFTEVYVSGCTVVSDRGRGIDNRGPYSWDMEVTDSIVAGHTDGDVHNVPNAVHSLVEDGSFSTQVGSGNLSGDPMFVDPGSGDYRLGWGSRCIDAASSTLRADLVGQLRVVDGDLQLVPAPDMGALEHRTLLGPKSIRLGQSIPLEVTGPAGGFSTVVVSPLGYAASGVTTPYGRFFLNLTDNLRLPSVPTFGKAPTQASMPGITDSSLVGTQIGIQALTRSTAAPAGGAFSQSLLVRIDPWKRGRIWVGTIPGGLFVSDDGGQSFELNRALWNHESRGGDLFAGDGTGTTHWFGTPAAEGEFSPGLHSIEIDPRDPKRIWVAISTAGVFETRDGGASWEVRNQGLVMDYSPEPEATWAGHDPHAITLCPGQPDHIWQQNHCGVFYSKNGAESWKMVSSPDDGVKFGFPVAVDPEDGKTAWLVPGKSDAQRVTVDGSLFVARTTDGGETWTALRNGLPSENAYDVVYRHAFHNSSDCLAFGSTTGNLYVSEDRGESWIAVAHNLPPIYSVRFG